MGGEATIGPRKHGVRIHYRHESLSQPKHWDVWDTKPRSLEFLQDSNNVVALQLVGPGERLVDPATNPSPVEFTTDGNPCKQGTALIRGGDFAWVDSQGEIDLPDQASKLRDFCIDERMVAFDAYDRCVASRGCEPPGDGDECGVDSESLAGVAKCVTPKQAEAFCRSVGGHLPTEDQWEAAVHAASDGRYRPAETDSQSGARPEPPRNGFWDIGIDGSWEWTNSAFSQVPSQAARSKLYVVRRGERPDGRSLVLYRRGQDPHRSQSAPIGFRCIY
jgi:formylglycine-generating enzyme required for sulfatase activity